MNVENWINLFRFNGIVLIFCLIGLVVATSKEVATIFLIVGSVALFVYLWGAKKMRDAERVGVPDDAASLKDHDMFDHDFEGDIADD